jgi:hypothetical protein
VSREELVFCADQGDDTYGWFWHEADVLLYALGQEVFGDGEVGLFMGFCGLRGTMRIL